MLLGSDNLKMSHRDKIVQKKAHAVAGLVANTRIFGSHFSSFESSSQLKTNKKMCRFLETPSNSRILQ